MIYKHRTVPKKITGLHALICRLPSTHLDMEKIQEEYRKRTAGFGGEQDFDRYFSEYRPPYPIAVLHDICLKQNGIFFQIDSLLITPAFIVIFEVKNLAGKITVTENPTQFIQEYPKGNSKVIRSPISELNRKEVFLKSWLQDREIDIPITKMVALAFTNELNIEGSPEVEIAFTYEIPTILYKVQIQNERLTRDKIRKIAIDMINNHSEYNPFPLSETMELDKLDIFTGVFCPQCSHRGMHWQNKKWNCKECNYSAADCHVPLIKDWFQLVSNRLTNRELRMFAGINNQDVAKRLLKKSNLQMKGNRGTAFYTNI